MSFKLPGKSIQSGTNSHRSALKMKASALKQSYIVDLGIYDEKLTNIQYKKIVEIGGADKLKDRKGGTSWGSREYEVEDAKERLSQIQENFPNAFIYDADEESTLDATNRNKTKITSEAREKMKKTLQEHSRIIHKKYIDKTKPTKTPKIGKKGLYASDKSWGEGVETSKEMGGNLNEWVKQRKGLKRGTEEYNIVQNKINEALGNPKRYPIGEKKVKKVIVPEVKEETPPPKVEFLFDGKSYKSLSKAQIAKAGYYQSRDLYPGDFPGVIKATIDGNPVTVREAVTELYIKPYNK